MPARRQLSLSNRNPPAESLADAPVSDSAALPGQFQHSTRTVNAAAFAATSSGASDSPDGAVS